MTKSLTLPRSQVLTLSSSLALTSSPSHALTLRLEGGLFAPDLLEALTAADLPGQKPQDFGLPPGRSLTTEIAAAFSDARALWQVFQNRLERLPDDDLATSDTREVWVIPLLRLLGYDLRYNPRALEVDGQGYPISHVVVVEGRAREGESTRAGEQESTRASHALPFSRSHALLLSSTPLHIVGYRQELGRLAPSGRPRLSPHALVQEYLNRSEALWGIVTNGRTLRLLRDSTFVRRQAYVEFDLETLFAENRFADFVLLYRLLHRTRLPAEGARPEDCLLETYYQQSLRQGGRVREHLRDGVEQAITLLANGFLSSSPALPLSPSPALTLSPSHALNLSRSPDALTLYQQLLRLIYRFLFLLVAEERGLMGQNPIYLEHYGISRLRRLCENRAAYTEDTDLWHSLRALWLVLTDEKLAALLGVPPLNGELFAHQDLDDAVITNRDLLSAFWYLSFYQEGSAPPRRVNYAALDTEELGSVYESLLDYHPTISLDSRGKPTFALTPGSERKSTGSYYTPPALVAELVKSALEPVIAEKLRAVEEHESTRAGEQESGRAREHESTSLTLSRSHPLTLSRSHPLTLSPSRALETALLSIKVLDPACGSGHFLLAAARRLGKELARLRSGEDEPAPERVREAARDVVAHCIYGVDKNPLAVELARVALWLESHAEAKPLTFLDHRIKCGDSLVGVFDLDVLKDGLPDEAFDPVSGDDRKLAASLKRQNKSERQGQLTLFGWNFDLDLTPLAETARQIETIPDDSPQDVRRKRQTYQARLTDPRLRRLKDACDLWTAAFFQPLSLSPSLLLSRSPALPLSRSPITTDAIRRALAGQPVVPQTLAEAQTLAEENRFFHWPLEFPEVFASPSPALPLSSSHALPLSGSPALHTGFDVILGNPPWERIKLQEEEFFASRDATIANAPNAAARKRLIAELPKTNPALWQDYQRALHNAESASRFLRGSGQYPLTGRGDINTYSVFAERVRSLLGPQGRSGIILPTGIATDATNQFFFADLVEKGQLVSLFDFENREALFPGVHRSYKFCLLTLCGERENTRAREQESRRAREQESERAREHESHALTLSRSPNALTLSPSPALTFSFFATRAEHLRDPRRVFTLTAADIARINPNTRTLPVFRTRQDADLTRAIYKRVPVLVNERTGENPWGMRFLAMFHMSNDSRLFRTRDELEAQGYRLVGNVFMKSTGTGEQENVRGGEHETSHALTLSRSHALYLPLYEAKMLWHYDHRYGTYEGVNDRTSTQLPTPDERQHADPHFLVQPWYWVSAEEVQARLGAWQRGWLLGFRDVTNATNERTAIFSLLPRVGAGHTLPILLVGDISALHISSLLANLNVLTFDWGLRQKIGGTHLTFFILRQLPVLPPSAYSAEDLHFIVPRVLELTYTAWDLQPFAQDVWNEADEALRAAILRQEQESTRAGEHESRRAGEHESRRAGEQESTRAGEQESTRTGEHENSHALTLSRSQNLPLSRSQNLTLSPFPWNESRRAILRAELDAYYARLYGLTRKQLRYILDPADLTERELADILDPWEEVGNPLDPAGYAARAATSTFPGETFRVLKEKELRQFGEYRTRRLVLEAWEKLKQN